MHKISHICRRIHYIISNSINNASKKSLTWKILTLAMFVAIALAFTKIAKKAKRLFFRLYHFFSGKLKINKNKTLKFIDGGEDVIAARISTIPNISQATAQKAAGPLNVIKEESTIILECIEIITQQSWHGDSAQLSDDLFDDAFALIPDSIEILITDFKGFLRHLLKGLHVSKNNLDLKQPYDISKQKTKNAITKILEAINQLKSDGLFDTNNLLKSFIYKIVEKVP